MAVSQQTWQCLWLLPQCRQVSSICQANLLSRCVGDLCRQWSYNQHQRLSIPGCCLALRSLLTPTRTPRRCLHGYTRCISSPSLQSLSPSQPAYAAFVQHLQNKWVFLCHTMPNMAQHLPPLDDAIISIFIPALLSWTVSIKDRSLLALPSRFGGHWPVIC